MGSALAENTEARKGGKFMQRHKAASLATAMLWF